MVQSLESEDWVGSEHNEASTAPVVIADIPTSFNPAAQHVAIVMATYNGSRFIEEQIRSIQAQSYPTWTLYVRDDGSRDETIQKVEQIEREDRRIKLIRDELGNQGAIGNFSTLMATALNEGADYVFFADQDDVWHQDKLLLMLGAMQKLETNNGKSVPLLVHCDLVVVDEDMQPIASSFLKYSRLSPATAGLGVLLCQNQVTGCACMINRALLELACPVPPEVLMHDWWLALLASSVGKIGFIPKPLVMYRQHAGNVLGAVSLGRRVKELLFSPRQWTLRMEIVKRGFEQAAVLEERIRERGIRLPPARVRQINTYSHILDIAPLKRASRLHAQKTGKSTNGAGLIFNILLIAIGRKKEIKSID